MGASSSPVAKNWPSNLKRRGTSGSSRATKRLESPLMLKPLATGFSRDALEQLSRQKGEPEWMLQKRLHAWETYENTPTPLGRRGDLGTLQAVSNFKFDRLTPFSPVAADAAHPAALEQSLQGS